MDILRQSLLCMCRVSDLVPTSRRGLQAPSRVGTVTRPPKGFSIFVLVLFVVLCICCKIPLISKKISKYILGNSHTLYARSNIMAAHELAS